MPRKARRIAEVLLSRGWMIKLIIRPSCRTSFDPGNSAQIEDLIWSINSTTNDSCSSADLFDPTGLTSRSPKDCGEAK